jgi:hypothetical protein
LAAWTRRPHRAPNTQGVCLNGEPVLVQALVEHLRHQTRHRFRAASDSSLGFLA